MFQLNLPKHIRIISLAAVIALTSSACLSGQNGASANLNGNSNLVGNSNTNGNTNTLSNGNGTDMGTLPATNNSGNAGSNVGNNAAMNSGGGTINTREPERYQATLVFSGQASGTQRSANAPTINAQVVRDGVNRRFSIRVPGLNQEVVFLDRAENRYLILPDRREYAVLSPEATGGIPIQSMMTPGQITAYLQRQPGFERVGEETYNGRTVTRYRYARSGQTNSAAGQAQGEAYVLIDNETGLPLRADLVAQSQGSVQGISSARGLIEMRDINTNIDPSLLEIPQGYREIAPDQIRGQIQQFLQLATAAVGLMGNMSAPPQNTPAPNAPAAPRP
ncbi:MAG: hypothetical protein MSG64_01375 [Pyrinomonadaceae bacterium MAG19_C2-C3]|nr:hypothetical protein [Pyrinomonadaceae bacterium MAG19_C2-C3]